MTLATSRAETALSFVHRFVPALHPGVPPVLLLHGTGGNEDDLLPFGRAAAPGSALLSPRGQVLENGMPRFFRRLREGVFDEADVIRRAHALAEFVDAARETYGIATPVAVGFSNGANIAAATLMLRPQSLAGVALLRGMVPLAAAPRGNLEGKHALILSGLFDPIVPADNSARLASQLSAAGAVVQHLSIAAGHSLTDADLRYVSSWIALIS